MKAAIIAWVLVVAWALLAVWLWLVVTPMVLQPVVSEETIPVRQTQTMCKYVTGVHECPMI